MTNQTISYIDITDGTPLTATVTQVGESAGLVIRKAAKTHKCQSLPGRESPNCRRHIAKGTVYLEYLGEAAAYQSGIRYCAPCALWSWGAEDAKGHDIDGNLAPYMEVTRGETPEPLDAETVAGVRAQTEALNKATGKILAPSIRHHEWRVPTDDYGPTGDPVCTRCGKSPETWTCDVCGKVLDEATVGHGSLSRLWCEGSKGRPITPCEVPA